MQVEAASGLSDFEYRVWDAYQLAADDYGVMRLSAVTIQAANDVLSKRPPTAIQRALEAIVAAGLVEVFEWKGRRYCYQPDWQNRQRVKHPRETMQPAPSLDACTAATQKLFQLHHPMVRNGGENSSQDMRTDSGNYSAELLEQISGSGSLACTRTRETANGQRLPANGSEGGAGGTDESPPMDAWARELVNLYPAQGRCGWNLVERPLYAVLTADSNIHPAAAWDALKTRLESHKRSYQWRVKGMVPRLDRYLTLGTHLQELPEDAPIAEQLSSKTNRTLAAAANIMRGGHS